MAKKGTQGDITIETEPVVETEELLRERITNAQAELAKIKAQIDSESAKLDSMVEEREGDKLPHSQSTITEIQRYLTRQQGVRQQGIEALHKAEGSVDITELNRHLNNIK